MKVYVNYDYYVSSYLIGRKHAVPEEVFLYWEKQARSEVDQYTFGRIQANPGLISEAVKDCICELVELLYRADSVSQEALAQGLPGPIVSYSNDGESGKFDLSQSVYTESGKAGKIHEIIYRYLGNTGLLYRGMQL